MEKVIVLILILTAFIILWCLPVYLIFNFMCWVFHLSFHLTFLQAFVLCLLISAAKNLLKEDK